MDKFRWFMFNSIQRKHALPIFPVKSTKVLHHPKQFLEELKFQIRNSKKIVSIASLYIGTGSSEKDLVWELEQAVRNNIKLKLRIVVDKNRGTRPAPKTGASTASICSRLQGTFPGNVSVNFFEMPAAATVTNARSVVESLFPSRLNEVFRTFHLKIYAFDDNVIVTGANLSEDYFRNRQDRYFVLHCAPLARFYHMLVHNISEYSFKLVTSHGNEKEIDSKKSIPRLEMPKRSEMSSLASSIEILFHETNQQIAKNSPSQVIEMYTESTVVTPTLQMKALGIEYDENVTLQFLDYMVCANKQLQHGHRGKHQLRIASGYLNFTDAYIGSLAASDAQISVAVASLKANGFYGSPGLSGILPIAYKILEHRCWNKINSGRLKTSRNLLCILEYERRNWTFHGKGMWYAPKHSKFPSACLIGSPNYGWRSVDFDMESQVLIHTTCKSLQRKMHREWKLLEKFAGELHPSTFPRENMMPHYSISQEYSCWIHIITHLIKKFM